VRLGAALPIGTPAGGPPHSRGFADDAVLLEQLGYASVWVFDALGRGFMLPDPLMALTAAATVTQRVELGTGVMQLPLRNTVELAHRALTLHHIAAGRFLFGVGPGSTEHDFRAVGAEYGERFRRFNEQWPHLRRLLQTGKDGDVDLTPWTTDGPRVLLGAWRGPMVTRAATEADGWIASAAYNDDRVLAEGLARFRAAGGERAIVTNIDVPHDVDGAIRRVRALEAIGFDDAVVFDRRPDEARFRAVRDAVS
jgi:alkanesulfonate monooxygenase SsuD/methylene tetrahydromethanopterin reductase-like flavin-dependent oxidoreductase (luciferase family)